MKQTFKQSNKSDNQQDVLFAQAVKVSGRFTEKEVKRVQNFFSRENVYKQLKTMVSFLIPHKKNVRLDLNIGGGSYTDGKSITVGLPELFIKRSYEEIFSALRALIGHESQHINSSDFKAFVEFQKDIGEYFYKKYKIPNNYGQKVAKHIFNSVEDGRIEKILCNKLPGYKKHIQFLNGSFWEHQEMKGGSELEDFLYTITSYSVTGLYPKGFKKVYKGTELHKNMKKIEGDIMSGVDAVTCKECILVCHDIVKKAEDYLVELLQNRSKEDEEFMNSIPEQSEFTTSEEKEHNTSDSVSTHFVPKKKEKKEEEQEEKDGEGSGSDSGDEKEEKKEEKGKGKGKGKGKKQEDDQEEDEADGQGKGENEEDAESENESGTGESDKSEDEKSDEEAGEGSKGDSDDDSDKDEQGDSDSDEDSDEESDKHADSNSKSKQRSKKEKDDELSESENPYPKGVPQDEEDDMEFDEEAVREQMQEITDEVIEEVEEKIKENKTKEKDSSKNKKDNVEEITPEELQEIENHYKRQHVKKFREIKGFDTPHSLPADIKREGTKFRKEVEKIFRNKETYNLRAQKRGVLDTANLWKFGVKDYNMFVKKGTPVTTDYVAFILQDGSGSMREDKKEFHSAKAMSVMEEGLKRIIPFKMSTFSVDGYSSGSVIHYTAKSWNDNSSSCNYSYNFHRSRRASGGNKDGYSIRVGMAELMKRPEKDKILIVLSDGLPSDYNGGYREGMVDVKQAVKEARQQGIHVVSLIFGEESFRDNHIDNYKFMYDKNIISCHPEQITNNLVKMLKKIISR